MKYLSYFAQILEILWTLQDKYCVICPKVASYTSFRRQIETFLDNEGVFSLYMPKKSSK